MCFSPILLCMLCHHGTGESNMDIHEAIELTITHWEGTPGYTTRACIANRVGNMLAGRTLEDITFDDTTMLRDTLLASGKDNMTVNNYMCALSTMYDIAARDGDYTGPKPKMAYARRIKKKKWWLNPDTEKRVIAWAEANNETMLAYYVTWARLTGLRVEETLRARRSHFSGLGTEDPILSVDGTKTEGAEATLPLSQKAASLAATLFEVRSRSRAFSVDHADLRSHPRASHPGTNDPLLFPCSYTQLHRAWKRCKAALGITLPTASLRAMRRTYARERSAQGCPLPLLQQLMRHRDPGTTMEYLRLTGGQFTYADLKPFI